MSENCREILGNALVFIAALALGLTVVWIIPGTNPRAATAITTLTCRTRV